MNKLDKKGFTLVELLVTLGIVGIVIILIFNLFTINLKSFNRSSDNIELQEEGQKLMNKIVSVAMESKDMHIYNKNEVQVNSGDISIKKVIFSKDESNHTFELSQDIVKYNNLEITNDIKDIIITPIDNKRSIKVRILLEKNKKELIIENQVLFRNKKLGG